MMAEKDEKGQSTFSLKQATKVGLKHCGKIFGTTVLSLFMTIILCIIIAMPMIIVQEAYFSAVEGRVNFGDTALIPTSGYAIMAITVAVSYFLMFFVGIINQTAWLYLYGDLASEK